jgi:hypothetical protein
MREQQRRKAPKMIMKLAMTFIIIKIILIYTPKDFVIIMKDPIFIQTNRAMHTFRVRVYPFMIYLSSVNLIKYST